MKKQLFLIFFLVVGCQKSNLFVDNLTIANNQKYWVRKEITDKGEIISLNNQFIFSTDGTYESYSSGNEYKKGFQVHSIEGNMPSYWTFDQRDSTFNVGSIIFKMVRFSSDSIFVQGKGYKGRFVFISHNHFLQE